MPNWCQNRLLIKGEGAGQFLKDCAGPVAVYSLGPAAVLGEKEFTPPETFDFTFNALHPVPPDVLAAGFDKAGYDWQIQNWGTKWEPKEVTIAEDAPSSVELEFDTAWGPPVAWVEHVATKYPQLRFTLHYIEYGNGFAGTYEAENENAMHLELSESDSPSFWKFSKAIFGMDEGDDGIYF